MIIVFFNILTVIITTCITVMSMKRLLRNNYSSLHICEVLYYIMNCLPLLVELFVDIESVKDLSDRFYLAMTDEAVAVFYNVFSIITCYILYIYANKYSSKPRYFSTNSKTNISSSAIINVFLTMMMFAPITLAIIIAPSPNVYFQYCYFYLVETDSMSIEYIYHSLVMYYAQLIAFAATLLKYYTKKQPRLINCLDVYICIFVISWVSQKRTMMMFLMLGILVIDFLKNNYPNIKILIKKSLIFLAIILVYFVYYSENVKPTASENNAFNEYTAYFSRLNVEKIAMYDIIYEDKMLDFRGQSVLYDVLWFIPRSLWTDKPGMYCKYFTAYVVSGDGSESHWLPFNYQVNIWGDWVSSFGLLGHFLALVFIICVIRYTDKSGSIVQKYVGLLMVIMYLMFGFEGTACWLYLLLLAMIFMKKSKHFLIYISHHYCPVKVNK